MKNKIKHIPKIKFTFDFLLFFYSIHAGYSLPPPTEAEKHLCGERPSNQEAEEKAKYRGRELERNLPPVQEQEPASWCYAFVSIDALNYHNYLKSNLKKDIFYQESNMISPIDAVGIGVNYLEKRADYPLKNPGRISTESGGSPEHILRGFQYAHYLARSQSQLPFHALNHHNEYAKKLVEKLAQEYKQKNVEGNRSGYMIAGSYCPKDLYHRPEFIKKIEGFETVNNWLYQIAHANNLLEDESTISHYQDIVKNKGKKDIVISPYLIHKYAGNNHLRYLTKIKEVLNPPKGPARPVAIELCGEDLKSKASSRAFGREQCTFHGVGLVGAYYENGRCIARIRNSWGDDWADGGYINLSVEELLESVNKRNRYGELENKYMATWISNDSSTYPRSRSISDTQEFLGAIDERFKDPYTPIIKRNRGAIYNLSGKMLKAFDINYGEKEKTYRGEVNDLGNSWSPKSGVISQNGRPIYVFKVKVGDGSYFTGTIKGGASPNSFRTGSGRYTDISGNIIRTSRHKLDNGNTFSGRVRRAQDNKRWEPVHGYEYSPNGEIVYVYGYQLSNSNKSLQIYSGPVQGSKDGMLKPLIKEKKYSNTPLLIIPSKETIKKL